MISVTLNPVIHAKCTIQKPIRYYKRNAEAQSVRWVLIRLYHNLYSISSVRSLPHSQYARPPTNRTGLCVNVVRAIVIIMRMFTYMRAIHVGRHVHRVHTAHCRAYCQQRAYPANRQELSDGANVDDDNDDVDDWAWYRRQAGERAHAFCT